jgi:DNA-binding transcriptional MocR family regulator
MIPRAVAHGVIYVAGQAFFVNALRQAQGAPNDRSGGGSGQNIIRLSFSAPSLDRIREGVRRLASVVRNELTERRGEAAGPSGVPPLSPAVR